MKLVVFGANGATGQWLVRLAVERGHQVTAVMREGASASVPRGVDVVRGDPLDAAFVDTAVKGKDAVVTALGLRLRRGSNPFSSIVSPPTLLSQSAAHMIAAMKRHGVSRISMVSAAGVGDSWKTVAWRCAWSFGSPTSRLTMKTRSVLRRFSRRAGWIGKRSG